MHRPSQKLNPISISASRGVARKLGLRKVLVKDYWSEANTDATAAKNILTDAFLLFDCSFLPLIFLFLFLLLVLTLLRVIISSPPSYSHLFFRNQLAIYRRGKRLIR